MTCDTTHILCTCTVYLRLAHRLIPGHHHLRPAIAWPLTLLSTYTSIPPAMRELIALIRACRLHSCYNFQPAKHDHASGVLYRYTSRL